MISTQKKSIIANTSKHSKNILAFSYSYLCVHMYISRKKSDSMESDILLPAKRDKISSLFTVRKKKQ